MQRLPRAERKAVAVLVWPAGLGLITIVTVAAIIQKEPVRAAIGNPFTWLFVILWIVLLSRSRRFTMRG